MHFKRWQKAAVLVAAAAAVLSGCGDKDRVDEIKAQGSLVAAMPEEGERSAWDQAYARELMAAEGIQIQELPGLWPETYTFYTGELQYRLLGLANQGITDKLTE